jgi:hypothetical protein
VFSVVLTALEPLQCEDDHQAERDARHQGTEQIAQHQSRRVRQQQHDRRSAYEDRGFERPAAGPHGLCLACARSYYRSGVAAVDEWIAGGQHRPGPAHAATAGAATTDIPSL